MQRVHRRRGESDAHYAARRTAAIEEYVKTVTIRQYVTSAETGELIELNDLPPNKRELVGMELECRLLNAYEVAHQKETGAPTRRQYHIPEETRARLMAE